MRKKEHIRQVSSIIAIRNAQLHRPHRRPSSEVYGKDNDTLDRLCIVQYCTQSECSRRTRTLFFKEDLYWFGRELLRESGRCIKSCSIIVPSSIIHSTRTADKSRGFHAQFSVWELNTEAGIHKSYSLSSMGECRFLKTKTTCQEHGARLGFRTKVVSWSLRYLEWKVDVANSEYLMNTTLSCRLRAS